jgi:hypothetical protein
MLTIAHDSDLRRQLMIEKRARDILNAGPQAHTKVSTPLRLERGQRVEVYHTLTGWSASMVTRHADGTSSIRQVSL